MVRCKASFPPEGTIKESEAKYGVMYFVFAQTAEYIHNIHFKVLALIGTYCILTILVKCVFKN